MKINGKEMKLIKDYGQWILFKDKKGVKEGIHKQELGLVKEVVEPPKMYINPEKVVIFSGRRNRRVCD